MMEKREFSIAIPAYKTLFLEECISSILNQSFPSFELIIVNDCSPNPVRSIVEKFSDPRIRYYENERNIGAENLVTNWNNILAKAEGDFFVMMGDDDLLAVDFLAKFRVLIAQYPNLNVYHCRSEIIDENGQPYMLTPALPAFESAYDLIWHRLNGHRLQYISDFVYRTSSLKKNGGFFYTPLAWGSDDLTAYRESQEGGIANINEPIFKYRRTRHTISSTGKDDLKMKAVLMQESWLRDFLNHQPDDRHDQILRNSIKSNLNKIIRQKKIRTISNSLQKHPAKQMAFWTKERKKFKINGTIIALGFLEHLKVRFNGGKYKF